MSETAKMFELYATSLNTESNYGPNLYDIRVAKIAFYAGTIAERNACIAAVESSLNGGTPSDEEEAVLNVLRGRMTPLDALIDEPLPRRVEDKYGKGIP